MQATLTPAAEKFIRRMLRLGGGSNAAFKMRVRPGGCSGYSAEFDIEAADAKADVVWQPEGVKIHLDQESATLIEGATVDFVDNLGQSGFNFILPGGPAQCCSPSPSAPQLVTLGSIKH
jgi:iron-sulfur cluster assembly protein